MIGVRALHLAEADLQFAEGEFAKAKATLNSILKDYTADVEALYKLALVQVKLKETDDARATLTRLLALAPWHTDATILQSQMKTAAVAPAAPAVLADRIIPNFWRVVICLSLVVIAGALAIGAMGADVFGSSHDKVTICGIPVPTASPSPTPEPTPTPVPTAVPSGSPTATTTTGQAPSSLNIEGTSLFGRALAAPEYAATATPLFPPIGGTCEDKNAFSVTITDHKNSYPNDGPANYSPLIFFFLVVAVVALVYPNLKFAKFGALDLGFTGPETPPTPPPATGG